MAGASQLAPVNWRVCHATGTRISLVSLVPVGFNVAHVLFVCRQLAPETGTGYWYQKTGQCVWPFTYHASGFVACCSDAEPSRNDILQPTPDCIVYDIGMSVEILQRKRVD